MTNTERGDQVQTARPVGEAPAAGRGRPVRPSRLGGLWIALTSGAVVLLLLLIFILENSQEVQIAYFGAHGHLPLGVALLLAAIFGILLVVIPGGGRMLQLRMAAHRHARRAQTRPAQPSPPAVHPGEPEQFGPEQRGPEQRGPEQRGPEQTRPVPPAGPSI